MSASVVKCRCEVSRGHAVGERQAPLGAQLHRALRRRLDVVAAIVHVGFKARFPIGQHVILGRANVKAGIVGEAGIGDRGKVGVVGAARQTREAVGVAVAIALADAADVAGMAAVAISGYNFRVTRVVLVARNRRNVVVKRPGHVVFVTVAQGGESRDAEEDKKRPQRHTAVD